MDRASTSRAGEVQKHKGGERCREGRMGSSDVGTSLKSGPARAGAEAL